MVRHFQVPHVEVKMQFQSTCKTCMFFQKNAFFGDLRRRNDFFDQKNFLEKKCKYFSESPILSPKHLFYAQNPLKTIFLPDFAFKSPKNRFLRFFGEKTVFRVPHIFFLKTNPSFRVQLYPILG